MDKIKKSLGEVEDILTKSKEVTKGKPLALAGIDSAWLTTFAEISRRYRDNKEFGISRYPYEAGPSVNAFSGGFFEHRKWPKRLDLEKQSSMRPVAINEANYINATRYWLAFHEAAVELRHEAAESENKDKMFRIDV